MGNRTAMSGILWSLCIGGALLALVAGFVPQREGPELRRRASMAVAQLRPEDMPAPILGMAGGWAVRGAVTPPGSGAAPAQGENSFTNADQWISFAGESVSIATVSGLKPVENDGAGMPLAPLLPPYPMGGTYAGEPAALAAAPPLDYGEVLAPDGRPLRWVAARLEPECDLDRAAPSRPPERVLELMPRQTFDAGNIFARARRYQDLVEGFAQRFGLSPSLVYAIIHTESNFSPVLVSSRSAMGLMQLLPSTAGGEVHTFLHGRPARVTFDDLANPETNIRYGTAYLHLLLNRHLGAVRNARSREYCAVASYNMGPNRFLRAFSEDRDTAIGMINAMTPDQVLQQLTTSLPVFETRAFVTKVTRTRREFAAFAEKE